MLLEDDPEGAWRPIGSVWQCKLRGRVGHAVKRSPREWVALYDGRVLAICGSRYDAIETVEKHAYRRRLSPGVEIPGDNL